PPQVRTQQIFVFVICLCVEFKQVPPLNKLTAEFSFGIQLGTHSIPRRSMSFAQIQLCAGPIGRPRSPHKQARRGSRSNFSNNFRQVKFSWRHAPFVRHSIAPSTFNQSLEATVPSFASIGVEPAPPAM